MFNSNNALHAYIRDIKENLDKYKALLATVWSRKAKETLVIIKSTATPTSKTSIDFYS